jgi:murein DD-endopeptidase
MWQRPTKTSKLSDDFKEHKARGSVNPGVDYPVAIGTPVMAVADGIIVKTVNNTIGAGGRMVMIRHGEYKADYLHLSKILIAPGKEVKAGDVIGLSGASGKGKERGYGPHLHLSIRKGGTFLSGKGNIDFEGLIKKQETPAPVVEATPVEPPTSAV